MTLSRFAFWFFILWIVGCGAFATGFAFRYIVLAVALCGAIFLCVFAYTQNKIWIWCAGLCVFCVAGAGYAWWYQSATQIETPVVQYGIERVIFGKIISSPRAYESTQSFILETPEKQKFSVQTSLTYDTRYADRVELLGVIQPLSTTTQYLAREGVLGIVSFAHINHTSEPEYFSLYRTLYTARNAIVGVFTKIFSRDQAALASGLLLGQQSASFSKELKDHMKASGTTHLVALSGYNIAIVIQVIYGLLSFVLSRKRSFVVMLIGIVLFVLMTGAESSVVRAAIMGSMILIAQRLSRVYDFAHAMAATAWAMILFNPLSFVFDIGFALSFVSLWGLAYITPIITTALKRFKEIPLWIVQAFSQTVGAQIAVAPFLLYWFGGVSVLGVVINSILLPLVPFTMGLSFVVGLVGLVSTSLAWICSFVVMPLLSFFIGMIHIGAQFGFMHYTIPWWGVVLCYMLMVWIGLRYGKKNMREIEYGV